MNTPFRKTLCTWLFVGGMVLFSSPLMQAHALSLGLNQRFRAQLLVHQPFPVQASANLPATEAAAEATAQEWVTNFDDFPPSVPAPGMVTARAVGRSIDNLGEATAQLARSLSELHSFSHASKRLAPVSGAFGTNASESEARFVQRLVATRTSSFAFGGLCGADIDIDVEVVIQGVLEVEHLLPFVTCAGCSIDRSHFSRGQIGTRLEAEVRAFDPDGRPLTVFIGDASLDFADAFYAGSFSPSASWAGAFSSLMPINTSNTLNPVVQSGGFSRGRRSELNFNQVFQDVLCVSPGDVFALEMRLRTEAFTEVVARALADFSDDEDIVPILSRLPIPGSMQLRVSTSTLGVRLESVDASGNPL